MKSKNYSQVIYLLKRLLPIVFMAIYFLISLNLFFMGSHFLEISLFIYRTEEDKTLRETMGKNMVFMLLEGLLTMLIEIFVGGGEDIVGAGQIVRRNVENVVAWLEVLAAQLQDHVGHMFSRQMVLPLYNFFHLTCLYAYGSLCFAYLKIHFL